MMRYNIHHLLVVEKGELAGIMTSHDLMMLQGTSPLSVAREIENQTTIDGLVPASRKINRIINILIREGAKAGNINRIITEINDRLLRKILEITEARMGPPPVGYCWIVYGSEGRKEQTFKTDQDNAIIYDDPGGDGGEAERYFSDFAPVMKEAPGALRLPGLQRGLYGEQSEMAPAAERLEEILFELDQYTRRPKPILQSLIFFDFRPVHGNMLLAEKLRAFLGHEIKEQNALPRAYGRRRGQEQAAPRLLRKLRLRKARASTRGNSISRSTRSARSSMPRGFPRWK